MLGGVNQVPQKESKSITDIGAENPDTQVITLQFPSIVDLLRGSSPCLDLNLIKGWER